MHSWTNLEGDSHIKIGETKESLESGSSRCLAQSVVGKFRYRNIRKTISAFGTTYVHELLSELPCF